MSKKEQQWAGTWKGGRFALVDGKKVFQIEKMRNGVRYSIRLATHDDDLALGELARFLADPIAYTKPPTPTEDEAAVFITAERLDRYLESIRKTVADHQRARFLYLTAWAEASLDLRSTPREKWRATLTSFDGGHRGRVEALNAFANWLVREGDLASWKMLVNTKEPAKTRAARRAYSLEELRAAFNRLPAGGVRDVFAVRAATGLHHTELQQIVGAPLFDGPLPDSGPGLRRLDGKHQIAGVLQVHHKNRQRHRQSLDAETFAAAMRLREHVPDRVTMWEALKPLVPSNLRHTFITLAGEVGELVTFKGAGVDRNRVAQAVGHRAGSTMTADRYEQLQVPAMISLPLRFGARAAHAPQKSRRARVAA